MKFYELKIKNGYIGKLRDGSMTVFIHDEYDTLLCSGCLNAFPLESFYDDDGKSFDRRYSNLDIMAIYKKAKFDGNTVDFGEPIWERPVDWSTVKVDTPILVSDDKVFWTKRYFSRYLGGKVYAFIDGATSWSQQVGDIHYNYAKLAI